MTSNRFRVVRSFRQQFTLVALATALGMSLFNGGCGGESNEKNQTGTTVYQTQNAVSGNVGPDGGMVGDITRASVDVPKGALQNSVQLKISEVVDVPQSSVLATPANRTRVSPVLAFEPHGQAFSQPSTLSVRYTASSASDLELLTSDGKSAWAPVAGASFQGGVAQAAVPHFSYFCVVHKEGVSVGTGGSGGASSTGGSGGAAGTGTIGTSGFGGTTGSAGAATGGSAGTATGGSAGTATGGSAGTATAGSAGTATAGSAGTATGGNGGNGGANGCPVEVPRSGVDHCNLPYTLMCQYGGLSCYCSDYTFWVCPSA